MTPYQYVTNNPIMFTDPTGMERNGIETELYNSNGEKIGEDVNGNDGNVSIIFDDNKAKKIEKNTKKGILASQDDVDSGVKTTKAVIIETLDNLTRTEKNGGIAEETSVVDPSGNITRGVVDTKSYEVNGSEIFSTEMPYVEGNNNTGIHSHVPLNAKINDTGGIEHSSSYQPGPLDHKAFKQYELNIITGRLGDQKGYIDSKGKTQLYSPPPLGASFYRRGQLTRSGSLTREAMEKIVK